MDLIIKILSMFTERYNLFVFIALFIYCINTRAQGVRNFQWDVVGNVEVSLLKDSVSLLRNPCCGWGLYDDAAGEVADADTYWAQQDAAALRYASFFYVRWRWSDMEPEEGKYAWLYDENYKNLIQGALDRGLKLAFRVYNNGIDNLRPGTPSFVKDAGARGYYTARGNHWTPYIDDPVFREKLENFIRAFAKEYDNPEIVDFIDGVNVGSWGECHGIELENVTQEKSDETLNWITSLYSKYFKNVILVMPMCSQFGNSSEMRIAVEKNGYAFRRDGLGSCWFHEAERKVAQGLYPNVCLIGESCYWQGNEFVGPGFYEDDTEYHFNSWRDVYEKTFEHAVDFHFNTLDLRTPVETLGWLYTAPDLVQKFISVGGYRIYPSLISYPKEFKRKTSNMRIGTLWKNDGSGFLPNNNPKWNYKYKIALALIQDNDIKCLVVDDKVDPSTILKEQPVKSECNIDVSGLPEGKYLLGVAIVDKSEGNKPGIKLALTAPEIAGGWYIVGNVTLK